MATLWYSPSMAYSSIDKRWRHAHERKRVTRPAAEKAAKILFPDDDRKQAEYVAGQLSANPRPRAAEKQSYTLLAIAERDERKRKREAHIKVIWHRRYFKEVGRWHPDAYHWLMPTPELEMYLRREARRKVARRGPRRGRYGS